MKKINIILLIFISIIMTGCLSSGKKITMSEKIESENREFLSGKKGKGELFRVLFSSDKYIVSQMRYKSYIKRAPDPGGDKYMMDELVKHNKIDEVREGIIRLWIYPDSGKIMKIRPQRPTYIVEIDQLITEDIQRWSFLFPKKVVEPTKFDIRYRVVLKKKMTDEDIIKEVQDKIRGGN
jgi:hypothetical protein